MVGGLSTTLSLALALSRKSPMLRPRTLAPALAHRRQRLLAGSGSLHLPRVGTGAARHLATSSSNNNSFLEMLKNDDETAFSGTPPPWMDFLARWMDHKPQAYEFKDEDETACEAQVCEFKDEDETAFSGTPWKDLEARWKNCEAQAYEFVDEDETVLLEMLKNGDETTFSGTPPPWMDFLARWMDNKPQAYEFKDEDETACEAQVCEFKGEDETAFSGTPWKDLEARWKDCEAQAYEFKDEDETALLEKVSEFKKNGDEIIGLKKHTPYHWKPDDEDAIWKASEALWKKSIAELKVEDLGVNRHENNSSNMWNLDVVPPYPWKLDDEDPNVTPLSMPPGGVVWSYGGERKLILKSARAKANSEV